MRRSMAKTKVLTQEELLAKQRELMQLQDLLRFKEGLPHLYGQKFYPWAKRVWDSSAREILLCSANQVGKSSIAIRKNIRLATDPSLWPRFWPGLLPGQKPNLFWYFYPTIPVAHTEYETKWEPYFLPRGEFKNHEVFGWEPEFDKGYISKIRFNSGVQIQFKAYSQKVKDLQTATVYHVTSDEELPVEFLPEISARTNATDGLFIMVFTATLGQLWWKRAMEPSSKSEETHKDALKIQVSLYDSMMFDDGTKSHWTEQKIKAAIAKCPTDAEIQRRIYGRFVKTDGLMFAAFDLERNSIDAHDIPKSWSVYTGVDCGSGGQSGHPAAIVCVAVSPDAKEGRIFRTWRGDGIPTTAADILDKYRELKRDLGRPITQAMYDHAAKDFDTVAIRQGEPFNKADKARDAGVGLLNTLFKTGMLKIFRGDPENEKLITELVSLSADENKRKAQDDLCDALRYCVMPIPWDFSDIGKTEGVDATLAREGIVTPPKSAIEERREWFMNESNQVQNANVQDEFDYWNEIIGASEGEY